MNKSIERIYSQFYKNILTLFDNFFRIMDTTIWPLTLLFAFTFLASSLNDSPETITLVILGMVGWQVVQQTQMGMGVTFMDEFWSNSLTHLFVTPIKLWEFVVGGILTGIVKSLIVIVLFLATATFVYGTQIPDPALFAAGLFFLFIFGISIGLLNLALMLPRGENAIFVVWTIPDILIVFSGVYYPLEILPEPIYSLALLLPSSHAFNLIKQTAGFATADWTALIVLSAIWLIGAWLLAAHAFRYAKKTGKLVRVG